MSLYFQQSNKELSSLLLSLNQEQLNVLLDQHEVGFELRKFLAVFKNHFNYDLFITKHELKEQRTPTVDSKLRSHPYYNSRIAEIGIKLLDQFLTNDNKPLFVPAGSSRNETLRVKVKQAFNFILDNPQHFDKKYINLIHTLIIRIVYEPKRGLVLETLKSEVILGGISFTNMASELFRNKVQYYFDNNKNILTLIALDLTDADLQYMEDLKLEYLETHRISFTRKFVEIRRIHAKKQYKKAEYVKALEKIEEDNEQSFNDALAATCDAGDQFNFAEDKTLDEKQQQ